MDHLEELSALRKRVHDLEQEVSVLRQQLEERKLVERAKGIVSRMLNIGEDHAYRKLRTYSTQHSVKLVEVARRVIEAEEPFRQLQQ